MVQANSGMYRVQDSYLEACQKFQRQDSKASSEWESFDMALWQKAPGKSQDLPGEAGTPGSEGPGGGANISKAALAALVGQDVFVEESTDMDNESEWSIDIPWNFSLE